MSQKGNKAASTLGAKKVVVLHVKKQQNNDALAILDTDV